VLIVLLATCAHATAQAWVRAEDPETEVCLFWTQRELHWSLNDGGAPGVELDALEAALERSAWAWQRSSCSDMALVYDGRTARRDAGFDNTGGDNRNLLLWRSQSCSGRVPSADPCHDDEAVDPFACVEKYDCWLHGPGVIALTTTSYNRRTGEVMDADIEFNGGPGGFRFTATEAVEPACGGRSTRTDCVATDVENTATHELGHFLGLAHSAEPEATMYASAPDGETRKRDLDADDEEALCTVYPQAAAVSTCTPSGRIALVAAGPSRRAGCDQASGDLAALGVLACALLRRRAHAPTA